MSLVVDSYGEIRHLNILHAKNEGALQHFHNVRRSAMGRNLLPVEEA